MSTTATTRYAVRSPAVAQRGVMAGSSGVRPRRACDHVHQQYTLVMMKKTCRNAWP